MPTKYPIGDKLPKGGGIGVFMYNSAAYSILKACVSLDYDDHLKRRLQSS